MEKMKPVIDKTLSVAACDLLEEILLERERELEDHNPGFMDAEFLAEESEAEMEAMLIGGLKRLPGDARRLSKMVRDSVAKGLDAFDITYGHFDEPYLELLDTLLNAAVTDLASELEEHGLDEDDFYREDEIDDEILGIDGIVGEPDAYELDEEEYPKRENEYDEDLMDDEDISAVEEISHELSNVPSELRDQIIVMEELVNTLNKVYTLPGYSAMSLRHLNALLD